jgi:hypothetical protein
MPIGGPWQMSNVNEGWNEGKKSVEWQMEAKR